MSKLQETATAETKPEAPKKAAAPVMYVLDSTARPDSIDQQGRVVSGSRIHEQIVDGTLKTFTFKQGEPQALHPAVALKFLKHEGFLLTDAEGNVQPFSRRPKQPEELGAGETIKLKDDETIAQLDELSNAALQGRVLEMTGGEKFATSTNRAAMIDFIVKAKVANRKANTSKERDVGEMDFVPLAEPDEEAA